MGPQAYGPDLTRDLRLKLVRGTCAKCLSIEQFRKERRNINISLLSLLIEEKEKLIYEKKWIFQILNRNKHNHLNGYKVLPVESCDRGKNLFLGLIKYPKSIKLFTNTLYFI
ncbi:hypothetical protein BpHYR1_011943 [Brachionus plicatilis]|uniref:Uncharacterized protein n=1 Tax=Brachionus plicatilis TaxID=10195 RepID=A0A3M7T030_BRAPC|nr:hypothetical protein BpHYR1_011943 [Brachionus plicatilis]